MNDGRMPGYKYNVTGHEETSVRFVLYIYGLTDAC